MGIFSLVQIARRKEAFTRISLASGLNHLVETLSLFFHSTLHIASHTVHG